MYTEIHVCAFITSLFLSNPLEHVRKLWHKQADVKCLKPGGCCSIMVCSLPLSQFTMTLGCPCLLSRSWLVPSFLSLLLVFCYSPSPLRVTINGDLLLTSFDWERNMLFTCFVMYTYACTADTHTHTQANTSDVQSCEQSPASACKRRQNERSIIFFRYSRGTLNCSSVTSPQSETSHRGCVHHEGD